MFNGGVPDQLHQFIASSRPNSVVSLLPLSTTNTITTTPFSSNSSIDNIHANYTPNHAHESHHHHHHHLLHHQLLPPLHHPNFLHPMLYHVQQQQQQQHHPKLNHHLHHHQRDIDEQAAAATGPNSLVSEVDLEMMETHTPIPELIPTVDHHHHNHHHSHHPHPHPHLQPWSEDELLALLGIRSTMENWFPDFTWEHVSRKLAELGFKRSAEKCKEKFEEESQYFNNNNNNNNNCSKSYSRICTQLSELEELYHGESQGHHHQHQNHHNGTAVNEKDQRVEENPSELDVKIRDINNGHHRQSLEELEISDSTRNETVVLLGGNSKEYYSDETEKVVVVGVEISKSVNIENNKQNNDSNNNKSSKKRKRSSSSSSSSHENYNKMKFDMFKGFCEEIVKKMMAQQEEMHNKLLEDMVKRDQEKVAIEEAWKKQEIDRMNKELEIMAHEQAVAGDRQASIIDFLNKVTCSNSAHESTQFSKLSNKDNNNNKEVSLTNSSSSSSLVLLHQPHEQNIPPPANPTITHLEKNQTNHHHHHTQNYDQQQQQQQKQPSSSSSPSHHHHHHQKTSSGISKDIIVAVSSTTHLANNPSATSSPNKTIQNPTSINDKEDLGKRWPRDEVLALINLRCNLYSTTTTTTAGESSDHHKEGMLVSSSTSPSSVKAPLWERISQGMLELGYKRSAKRCKEKWENINKYFRKTKDANKKRSVDSRTCPYFHQLSSLYNKGATTTLVSVSSSQGKNNNDHHQDHIVINNDDHHSPSSVVVLPEISTAIATASRQLIIDESTTPADDDHNHDSTQLHIDHGERSSSVDNIIIHDHHHHHHHQEVAVVSSTAFDFEF